MKPDFEIIWIALIEFLEKERFLDGNTIVN